MVDQQQAVGDLHLVGVGVRRRVPLPDQLGPGGVGHVQDRGTRSRRAVVGDIEHVALTQHLHAVAPAVEVVLRQQGQSVRGRPVARCCLGVGHVGALLRATRVAMQTIGIVGLATRHVNDRSAIDCTSARFTSVPSRSAGTVPERSRSPILLLQATGFVSTLDRFAMPPMLVVIAHDLGVPLADVVRAAGAYFLAYGLSQPLWGIVSDRLGPGAHDATDPAARRPVHPGLRPQRVVRRADGDPRSRRWLLRRGVPGDPDLPGRHGAGGGATAPDRPADGGGRDGHSAGLGRARASWPTCSRGGWRSWSPEARRWCWCGCYDGFPEPELGYRPASLLEPLRDDLAVAHRPAGAALRVRRRRRAARRTDPAAAGSRERRRHGGARRRRHRRLRSRRSSWAPSSSVGSRRTGIPPG